jgi:hypothetical protein
METKIPSPQELRDQISQMRAPQVEAAIRRIVGQMTASKFSRGSITINLESGESDLERELIEAFRLRGWNAKISSDQREPKPWITLTEALHPQEYQR